MFKQLAVTAGVILAATAPAFAHVSAADNGSFLAGFTHPLLGPDHIVVMVAVGLWAATIGGRAVWAVPAAFVGAMVIGYFLALTGLALPFAEPMILASTVALGLLVAAAVRLPVMVGVFLVGLFAVFHGHAHGSELGVAAAVPFGFGFALATALLHSAGIATGLFLGSGKGIGAATGSIVARLLGGAAAATGIVLALSS